MAKVTPRMREAIVGIAQTEALEPCLLEALITVESSGNGFLVDGRCKILFEGHVFWSQLEQRGIAPEPVARERPDLCYPKWTKAYYIGGAGEWGRLQAARTYDEDAALCSASWGLFQIMGFNYPLCKYVTIQDFVQANGTLEGQLDVGIRFLRSTGLLDKLRLHQWASFAKGYNGPGYAKNKYDQKLKKAYETCQSRERPSS